MKISLIVLFGAVIVMVGCNRQGDQTGYTGTITVEHEIGLFRSQALITNLVTREHVWISNGSGVATCKNYKIEISGLATNEAGWTYNTISITPPKGVPFKVDDVELSYKGEGHGSANQRSRLHQGEWVAVYGYESPGIGAITMKTRMSLSEENGQPATPPYSEPAARSPQR